MQSAAQTVDEFLAEIAPPWDAVATRLRALCRDGLVDCDEVMAYGMATYQRDGAALLAFTRQARYFSLYVSILEVLDAHRPALAGRSMGKGCVRFTRPEQVDWAVVASIVAATAASTSPPC